jgi:Flp pilus assembly protein TadG
MLHMLSYSPALTRLAADERGVAGIVTAIAATMLMGFCGLAVDVIMWEVNQRSLQGAADQAALAAATAYRYAAGETLAMGDSATAKNGAYATAIRSGYPAASVTLAAYNNGSSCTNDGCLQVAITQQQQRYFTAIFSTEAVNASASAVGTCNGCGTGSSIVSSSGGAACVMALDTSGKGVFTDNGGAVLSLIHCNLYNNSPNTDATVLNGGGLIEGCSATNACGSQAFLAQPDIPSGYIDVPIVTNAEPAPDPYASLTPPQHVRVLRCTGIPFHFTGVRGHLCRGTRSCNRRSQRRHLCILQRLEHARPNQCDRYRGHHLCTDRRRLDQCEFQCSDLGAYYRPVCRHVIVVRRFKRGHMEWRQQFVLQWGALRAGGDRDIRRQRGRRRDLHATRIRGHQTGRHSGRKV